MSALRREIRVQLRLALPVIVVQIGLMLMGVVDAAFLGRVSAEGLAAVTLGNSWSFTPTIFGLGVLTALDPVIGQAFGARDELAIARGLQRGLFLAVLVSIPIGLVVLPAEAGLRLLGQPEEVVGTAGAYAVVSILGIPAFLIFCALRHTLQAIHVLRPIVIAIVATNLLNVFLDWVLIFGRLGCPPLGAVGSSWGTVISRWAMVAVLLALAWPVIGRYLSEARRAAFRWKPLFGMVHIGWPVGTQFTLEFGAFALIAFMMGRLGATSVAGHQVALNLASASFMVPLGISMAAAVRVGNEIGRRDLTSARRAAKVALGAGAGIMAGFGILFLLAPAPLARLITDQPEVLALAVALMPLAAGFQVFDGLQVVSTGILRGTADTRVPMLIHFAGFWLVGIPLAWFLGFRRGLGADGLWWGLVASLGAVAVVQLWRVRHRLGGDVLPVRLDDESAYVAAAAADPEALAPTDRADPAGDGDPGLVPGAPGARMPRR